MIIRIVKLTFHPEKVDEFLKIFEARKHHIQEFPGCKNLQLMKVQDRENIFFTYSEWSDLQALENYRNSEFFSELWPQAKLLFSEKPEAWSLSSVK